MTYTPLTMPPTHDVLEQRRQALIDHLIAGHGAGCDVNACWPRLDSLRVQHRTAHDPPWRPTGWPQQERPGHRHSGREAWE